MFASTLVATALTFSALGLAAPADNSFEDAVYPSVVREGLSYSHQAVSDDGLRGIGHSVCTGLDSGLTKLDVANALMSGFDQNDPMDPMAPREAGYIIGASTASYCPSHTNDPID